LYEPSFTSCKPFSRDSFIFNVGPRRLLLSLQKVFQESPEALFHSNFVIIICGSQTGYLYLRLSKFSCSRHLHLCYLFEADKTRDLMSRNLLAKPKFSLIQLLALEPLIWDLSDADTFKEFTSGVTFSYNQDVSSPGCLTMAEEKTSPRVT
jgi:hypothetical protein